MRHQLNRQYSKIRKSIKFKDKHDRTHDVQSQKLFQLSLLFSVPVAARTASTMWTLLFPEAVNVTSHMIGHSRKFVVMIVGYRLARQEPLSPSQFLVPVVRQLWHFPLRRLPYRWHLAFDSTDNNLRNPKASHLLAQLLAGCFDVPCRFGPVCEPRQREWLVRMKWLGSEK